MNALKWHRRLLLCMILPTSILAGSFEYFDKGIDFWKSGEASEPKMSMAVKKETEHFAWDKFLSPNNKEFFKEGDYTPPEPFMEIVRNPSDYNLKMWFAYMDKKNELAANLRSRMQEYLAKNAVGMPPNENTEVIQKVKSMSLSDPDTKQFRFRLYFSSQCPHCQRMFGTLVALQKKGFFVEARQVDLGNRQLRLPFPTQLASKEEIGRKEIESVPVLLIGDLKRKLVYRLTGYQSTEDVLKALAQKNRS